MAVVFSGAGITATLSSATPAALAASGAAGSAATAARGDHAHGHGITTPGTAEASKVLVADASRNIGNLARVTSETLTVGALTAYASAAYPTGNTLDVDEDGNVRTDGFLLSRDATRGLVLKSANGTYWDLTVSNAGSLVVTSIGSTEP